MNRALQVLHVEDSHQDVTLLARYLLRAGYEPVSDRVETRETMRAALESNEWDVILCDYSMPNFNALGALALVKEMKVDIPFIIISGTVGEAIAVEAMRAGAHDYLMKDNLVRLGATIERELREAENRRAHRQIEAELRESEAQYRRLLETTNEGVWAFDAELKTTCVNQHLADMLQVQPEEMMGRSALDFLDAEARLDVEQRWPRRMKGMKEQYDLHIKRPDGTDLWTIVCATPIFGKQNRFVGALSMITDITERKRAEEQLRESEERYRDTVENARDIIYTHDLRGNYTSVNKAGEQITGYTREEARTMNVSQTVAPEFLDKARQMLGRKLNENEETVYDLEIIAKDGRRIAVEVNTRLIYRDGVAVGVEGIARDITERKHLEAQLRQSQKMEAVGRLAGGIAHDFNNLLTVINGYSELALQQLQPEDTLTRNLEEIKRAGNRAGSLTRQLLAFSRKQVLQPKVLDLNVLISDLEKMLRRVIGEDVDLRTVLKPKLGRVDADPGQIEQVIMNLVVNARDAMPDGGQLTIETENAYLTEEYARQHITGKPGPYVMVAVSDNGSGMNDETKARLFEPFFTTKDQGKGTGLGLSTVYGIVKQSMGYIWVYSEVGLGTTFRVYLPSIDGEADSKPVSQPGQLIARGSETILLVEDDEMVRDLTRTTLEASGYRVLQATNGVEAILVCQQNPEPIHLLLTDVVMPGMSGRAVADRLHPLRPQMLVLYMSGYTEDAIVQHGVLNEGVNFIEKPFAPSALARKVREVLDAGN
ncbi:MAG: two-component system, cell cycle sensor histidine kinase and response regulator CckA [Blastocatellia bacterium]|jgi:PAS domain S-box-containing protein|nr:two-component system, cell cycle sensor histidine kinase and response regulator CckA [Blastocatellia bacterium]